jgi:hypothetical protein
LETVYVLESLLRYPAFGMEYLIIDLAAQTLAGCVSGYD